MKETRLNGSEKILLLTSEFPPGPGGIGNHAFNLAKYLKLNSIEVNVLAVSDFVSSDEEEEFDKKQNFKVTRFRRHKSRVKTYLKRVRLILDNIKSESYTHVIFSGRIFLMTSLLLKKYRGKIKFIAIAHGGDVNAESILQKTLVNKALSSMDLIIPVSNFSRSKIKIKTDPEKVCVIPNGFDFENIQNLVVTEKSMRNGSLSLVTVGTVWPRKGHHNVFNALPKIISEYPETRYNIIGRLADLSRIKNFIEDKKFKEHLKIHGAVSNEEMYKVLNDSQIFILLSESQASGDFEGFGIAVLEANYFGLPAIGSKNSGLEDAIKNGVSGILVEPRHINEVSDAVNDIAKNYSKFSQGAKEWASEHHWSNIIKRYIKAIENIN